MSPPLSPVLLIATFLGLIPAARSLNESTLSRLSVMERLDRAANLTSIAGRPVQAAVLYKDAEAQIVQIDGFLTPEQCEAMVLLAEKTIHGPLGTSRLSPWSLAHQPDAWTQRCEDACAQDPVLAVVEGQLEEFCARPKGHMEHFQMLHYQKHQHYGLHHDYIYAQSQMEQGPREFTMMLYLNDVEEGGETHFPSLGIKVRPKRGRVIIWPNVDYHDGGKLNSKTHHAALPVVKGEKWGTTQWVHKGVFRADS